MSRTLWIGDVQENWTEDYLCQLMRNAKGLVSVKLMRDRVTNVPEGYGFVDFATEEDAMNALQGYNGRPIPHTGFTFRLNYGGNRKVVTRMENYTLYVGELDPSVTDNELYNTFKEKYISFCGAKIMRDTNSGISKGFGFVQFRTRDEAETAIKEMTGYVIKGRPIKLSYASANRWLKDEESVSGSNDGGDVDFFQKGPEIPNIRPPPLTPAMRARALMNNSTGGSEQTDAYGNPYDNPMFSYDPVYQAAMQALREKKMRANEQMGMGENDVEVPTDRLKPLDVKMENEKFMRRAGKMFEMPSLSIPKVSM